MRIILLKDVPKLGKKYDVKDVPAGYALNLLIPTGAAVAAVPEAMKRLKAERAKAEGERKLQEDLIAKNLKGLDGLVLSVSGKASDKGHLFAGLHREAIAAEILKQTQLQVDPSFIQLEHPIKEAGEHEIEVKTATGESAKFKIVIEAQ
ncbi:MAG: 50S ribosomal protein L9 [Minisyncoccia bacterium]|jgi:large subunit ribosomal protein L9